MPFLRRSRSTVKGQSTDRILTPTQVRELLEDDYGNEDAVVFIHAATRPIMPTDVMFLPVIQFAFSEDRKLGMIYGTGSGCALVLAEAIRKVQGSTAPGNMVRTCDDLIATLKTLGYGVKQDPRFHLDLLP